MALKLFKQLKTGAFNEPEWKLWPRSGPNKAKAFVQAEFKLQLWALIHLNMCPTALKFLAYMVLEKNLTNEKTYAREWLSFDIATHWST